MVDGRTMHHSGLRQLFLVSQSPNRSKTTTILLLSGIFNPACVQSLLGIAMSCISCRCICSSNNRSKKRGPQQPTTGTNDVQCWEAMVRRDSSFITIKVRGLWLAVSLVVAGQGWPAGRAVPVGRPRLLATA